MPRSRKTSKGSSSLSSVTRACIFQVFEEPFNQMDRFRIHVPVKSSAPAPSRFSFCRLRQLFNPQISCFPTDRLKNSFPKTYTPSPPHPTETLQLPTTKRNRHIQQSDVDTSSRRVAIAYRLILDMTVKTT